jgi:hypothetical protein
MLRGSRSAGPHWLAVKQDLAGSLRQHGAHRWSRWLVHEVSVSALLPSVAALRGLPCSSPCLLHQLPAQPDSLR